MTNPNTPSDGERAGAVTGRPQQEVNNAAVSGDLDAMVDASDRQQAIIHPETASNTPDTGTATDTPDVGTATDTPDVGNATDTQDVGE